MSMKASSLHDLTLTVGIAAYNEEKSIRFSLEHVLSQLKDINSEVIVVSSGCTDKTNQLVAEFAEVRLIIESERRGKVSAVQQIFAAANGHIILLTDADIILEKNAINTLINYMSEKGLYACTGRVIVHLGESNLMNQVADISCEAWHRLREKQVLKNDSFLYPTGYLMAIRKQACKNQVLDLNAVADDASLAIILFKRGISFSYCPDAQVRVLFPQTVRDYFKQKIRNRIGRRQAGRFSLCANTEREWRRELWRIGIERKKLWLLLFTYALDGFCRLVACAIVTFSHNPNLHKWPSVPSTKLIDKRNARR